MEITPDPIAFDPPPTVARSSPTRIFTKKSLSDALIEIKNMGWIRNDLGKKGDGIPGDILEAYLGVPILCENCRKVYENFQKMCEKREISLEDLAAAVGMLREAKENHLPVMITNEDGTRALYIKDANSIKCKISVKEIGFKKEI